MQTSFLPVFSISKFKNLHNHEKDHCTLPTSWSDLSITHHKCFQINICALCSIRLALKLDAAAVSKSSKQTGYFKLFTTFISYSSIF